MSIWMAGFHIGYKHRNAHGSDWNDESLFRQWEKDNSAMCEANSNAVLGDGWRDARKELPEFGVKVIVYYQKYENKPKDFYVAQFLSDDDGVLLVFEGEHCGEENFDGIFWKAIDPPAFA